VGLADDELLAIGPVEGFANLQLTMYSTAEDEPADT
jgi:hypothetical protein